MTVPTSLMVECPNCKEETLHEVLSGKTGGKSKTVLDSTVRCRECSHVHHVVLKGEKPLDVPVVISWLDQSTRSSIPLGPDEVVEVDDEIMCGDTAVLITSIESKGARVKRAKVSAIETIWGKKFDKVRVSFSVSNHGRSYSEHTLAVPEEEFFIGDILNISRRDVVIHTIKTKDKTLKRGSALARDIVRAYASVVRKSEQ